MIEKAIYSRLSSDTSITNVTSTRIYNGVLSQEVAIPAVVFYRISTSRNEVAHSGPVGIATAIIQINIYADTIPKLRGLTESVRKRLHCYKGTAGGVAVMLSRCIQERDAYVNTQSIYQTIMEFRISFREAI